MGASRRGALAMESIDSETWGQNLGDDELMGHLAEGRQEALGPLHGRYAPMIFGLAARSLENGAAEEIVQEVFVTVWRKAATFDPARGTFRGWVLRIAHSRVLNELRRRGRRPRPAADPDGQTLAAQPDRGPEPDEAAWRSHRREVVQAAVEALPPPQRQALSLAFFEDLTHEQVATLLDLPLGTAKSRIRAGLRLLRAHAGLLAAAGLALFVIPLLLVRDPRLRRYERAMELVTSSDVVPLRLTAAPGVPAGSHGNYRGRPGVPLAVLTVSLLPPAPEGRIYRAWARHAGRWTLLGTVRPDRRGHDLLIDEGPALAEPPGALLVSLELPGERPAPAGAPVLRWAPTARAPAERIRPADAPGGGL